ncbi:MAG: DEAD/DEAH box helicase, partial [Nocardioidaceae bacterium]
MSNADRLHPVLVHHIVNTLGWPSMRPLQERAVAPLLDGGDALLLAPTAGGKTEAAVFPVLSAMAREHWQGLSVLYVCPLRALLNNLEPRLAAYCGWLGRRAALWHGDVGGAARRRILDDPPDILLTTPESLEAMLISRRVDAHELFARLRAVIVDEVHAFAGDDRGWHLLAVLERLARLAGRPPQRIGLSATVGNPDGLLRWLQGSGAAARAGVVVAPETPAPGQPARSPEVGLDYVGGVAGAAKVVASLHKGEKRLVFCDSRRRVEELGRMLRGYGVATYLSHSSLSADQRRRSELAFAEARDCVIVATSTLELGVDIGDLDRVVQIDAPGAVAAFLQRLGRTGRRSGTPRNCLFLATDDDSLLQAGGLLRLWAQGFVEPVTPPPDPWHIAAQQVLALVLQEGRVGDRTWREWWNNLGPLDDRAGQVVRHLVATGHLETDSGMLFMGPEAERAYGRRHFLELTSVFVADPEFAARYGREEVGRLHPLALTGPRAGPRVVLLAGRSWRVAHIDWRRRRCQVEPTDVPGDVQWRGTPAPRHYRLCRAMREVAAGEDPPVTLSRRATARLAEVRDTYAAAVGPAGT